MEDHMHKYSVGDKLYTVKIYSDLSMLIREVMIDKIFTDSDTYSVHEISCIHMGKFDELSMNPGTILKESDFLTKSMILDGTIYDLIDKQKQLNTDIEKRKENFRCPITGEKFKTIYVDNTFAVEKHANIFWKLIDGFYHYLDRIFYFDESTFVWTEMMRFKKKIIVKPESQKRIDRLKKIHDEWNNKNNMSRKDMATGIYTQMAHISRILTHNTRLISSNMIGIMPMKSPSSFIFYSDCWYNYSNFLVKYNRSTNRSYLTDNHQIYEINPKHKKWFLSKLGTLDIGKDFVVNNHRVSISKIKNYRQAVIEELEKNHIYATPLKNKYHKST